MLTTMSHVDHAIAGAVRQQLDAAPELDASMVAITVQGRVVTLSGYVPSYADSVAAVRAVRRVNGVAGVANELAVKLAEERTDPDLTHDAVAALRRHVQVPLTVQATVRDGHLSLTGEVEWMYQKAAAERAVKYLRGLRGMHNHIVVAPTVSVSDVQRRISDALQRNALVDARHITVRAEGGTVTLTGIVRSWFERYEAERAAWSAPGVVAVDDRIQVNPQVREPERL